MGRSRIPHAVLRNIELEVMELRASLEAQSLHRDAIDDICDEKRQRLIEEHEASLASPARRDSERDGSENSRSSVHLDEELEQSPPAKERDREKECETEKDAEIEAGRERERAKEKEDRKPLEE